MARPDSWVVECPDCDLVGRVKDIVMVEDCEGAEEPSDDYEHKLWKIAEFLEKVELLFLPQKAKRRIPWRWSNPAQVFRAVNIDDVTDELNELCGLIEKASKTSLNSDVVSS